MSALLARLSPFLARGRAAAAWLWKNPLVALLLVVLVLVAVNARNCSRARGEAARADAAEAAAAEARERDGARRAGLPVVEPVPDVRPALEAALKRSKELEAEVARVKALLPGAKPVAVFTAATAPAPIAAAVPAGELLRLEVDGVTLQGPAGARVVVGTAAARRAADGALLLRAPWSAPVTEAFELAHPCPATPPSDRAWRAGPVGGGGADTSGGSWLVGAAATLRLDLWGHQPEVLIAAAGGPGRGVVLIGPLF